MTPDFALSLSSDRLRLMQRADAGWLLVGEVALPVEHLRTAMSELRARGEALNGGPFKTKLLIPNEQIRYLTLGDADASEADVRAALDGATPYPVSDLVYDYSKGGGRTYVAAVARETLTEAEAFAREHRINPVSFAAAPEPFTFVGEAVFGPCSDQNASVFRDPDPVRVVGVARLPDPASRIDPAMPAPELVDAAPKPTALSFQRSQTVEPPPPELVGLSAPEVAEPIETTEAAETTEPATMPTPTEPGPIPPRRIPPLPERVAKAVEETSSVEPLRPAEPTPALTDGAVDFQARLRARIAEQGLDKRLPRSTVPRPAFLDDPPPPPSRAPRRSWREALRAAKGKPLSDDPPDTEMPSAPKVSFKHASTGAAAFGATTSALESAAVDPPAQEKPAPASPTRTEPRITFGAQALKEMPVPPPAPEVRELGASAAPSAAGSVPWTDQLSRDKATAPVATAPPLRATNAPPAELTFELVDALPERDNRRTWILGGLLTLLLLGGLALVGSFATGGSDGLARILGRGDDAAQTAEVPETETTDVGVPVAIATAPDPDASGDSAPQQVPQDSAADPQDADATLPDDVQVTAADAEDFVPSAPQIDIPSGLSVPSGTTDSGASPTGTESGPALSAPLAVAPGQADGVSGVATGATESAELPEAAAPVIGDAATQPVAPSPLRQPSGLGAVDAAPGAQMAPGGLAVPGGLADRSQPEVDTADPAPPEPEPEVAEVLEAPPILPAAPLGRVLSPAEAQRIYAATGVWQRAPRLPVTPRTTPAAEVASGATDALDTVTRAATPELDVVASFDSPLPAQINPPAPDAVFERDDRGFVIATAEGAATPDGILVYAGAPALQPPIRPGTEPPPFDPATLAEPEATVTDTGEAIVVAGRLSTRVPLRPGTQPPQSEPEAEPADAQTIDPPATEEAPVAEAPPTAEEPGDQEELSTFMSALSDALVEEAANAAPAAPDEASDAASAVSLLDALPQNPPSRPADIVAAAPVQPEADSAPRAFGVLAASPIAPPSRPAALAPEVAEDPAEEVGNRLDTLPARPPSRPASVVNAVVSAPAAEPATEEAAVAEEAPAPATSQAPLPANVQRLAALPVEPVLRPASLSTRAAPETARLGAPIVNPPTRPATLVAAPATEAPASAQTPEADVPAGEQDATPDAAETEVPATSAPAGVQLLETLPQRPPSRPATASDATDTPAGTEDDSELLFLDRASVRPQPRPGTSNEDLASSTLAALTQTQPAASATPGAVTLEALLRPAARPETPPTAGPQPETGDSSSSGDLAASLRPQARPGDIAPQEDTDSDTAAQTQAEIAAALAAAAITLENSVPSTATATQQAVARSPRPDLRPRNMDAIVQRARAETARLAARQQTQQQVAAPRTVQPSGTTATNVASAATQDGAINLGRMNLIGVAGSDSDRRALVRLANGRMQRVGVGDRLDGGQVQSIGDDFLTYVRGGRAVRLDMTC